MNEPQGSCPLPSSCQGASLCPLSRVVAGACVRIKQLSTPPEVSHRLRELGMGEEQPIRLLSRQANYVCLVCNARLGISSQLADQIFVEHLPAQIPLS